MGRIAARVCLQRNDGRPDDCGEIAVRPGGSSEYSGHGVDFTVEHWGSRKSQNDWLCHRK